MFLNKIDLTLFLIMWGQLLSLLKSKHEAIDIVAGIILGALMGFILVFIALVGGDTL